MPRNVAGVDIHGVELTERRRRARDFRLWIPEPTDDPAPWRAADPRAGAAAIGSLHHLRDLTQVHHVGEHEAERRFVRHTVPVAAANRAREIHHRSLGPWRRV